MTSERSADPVLGLAAAAAERAVVDLAVDADPLALEAADAALAEARRDAADHVVAPTAAGPLALLCRRAGLGGEEAELLVLLVGLEVAEHCRQLLVSLTGDRERHRLELWMLPHLLPGTTPALGGPASDLRRAALVEHLPRGAFGRTAVALAPRVMWALWGDTQTDPALPPGLEVHVAASVATGDDPPPDGVLVHGPDPVRRRLRAVQALRSRVVLVTAPPEDEAGWAALVREATIDGAAVLLEDASGESLPPRGRWWVEQSRHVRWAVSSTRPLPLDELPRRAWREVAPYAPEISAAEWREVAGADAVQPAALTAEQLQRMGTALGLSGGDADAAYRRLTDSRIDALATRVVPRAGWDDLVLAPGRKARLRDLVDRYRHAGQVYDGWGLRPSTSRGIVALFSGRSGTGKTMSAEVVAHELRLDMYRLDLSSVVSKYIGETEKNLDALFDAASIGGTVLFFDEADAMFGKRTEVTDAHDRHANVGTSYLLQRLERYDGIVVLATNYEKNIDEAFLRRVHVRIDFPNPLPAEREELWRLNLHTSGRLDRESTLPLGDDIDLAWLVDNLEISGAGIRNAVVDAAFLAAQEDQPLGMSHLVRSAARELQKSSLRITRDRFGEWYDVALGATS